MRIELPCDLFSIDGDGIVTADLHAAARPERVRPGAVLPAGVPAMWSWVLVREVAGDVVFAEVLNGPHGVGHTPPAHLDADAAAEIEERFWALGGRFHPADVAAIRREAARLDPGGVAVLYDPDHPDCRTTNGELLARGDDASLWELCQRGVDTGTASQLR